ncbi:MAG: FAD-dependent oxidoreductase, partial [Planctomycetaceae bacterium]|nr:FAD-dependent oxidoreductase [Planctomycetaceae bacterium]
MTEPARGGFWKSLLVVASLVIANGDFCSPAAAQSSGEDSADVLIYGATPSGIAAALAAADDGCSVLLIEPTERIGGLVTSGLSHTDFHSRESLTGSFLKFAQRVDHYYAETYGVDSPQRTTCFGGTFAEPKINLLIFQQMLAECPGISVRLGLRLESVELQTNSGGYQRAALRKIASAAFVDAAGNSHSLRARQYIDGSYEGDLMALAGVEWTVGREAADTYGESLAPAAADQQLQAYNFRFIMTRDPQNRVTPEAPVGYRREDFVGVLEALKSGQIQKVFDYPAKCIFKAQTPPLPNGKYDINDVSRNLVRLSLPGKNTDWPSGTAAQRHAVFMEHLRDQVGLLYFLQNDDAVPARFRVEAREWGWCRDEFTETDHLPPQLYVREARRMIGQHVYVQRDSEHAPNDARALLHCDAIAMADYGNNCHGTLHEGPRFGGKHSGEFYNPVPPYQIPYGVLVPRDVANLLVSGAVSSSHVGFCALRLEPIWMSLGQASGHAASLALKQQVPVQNVPVRRLQARLHQQGSATIYVSDVLPDHADFAAVQWWVLQGGLHGLQPMPPKPSQRGIHLHGQYYGPNPGHAAELNTVLDEATARRWLVIAELSGLAPAHLPSAEDAAIMTRGDFVR